jgi:hypothetical protein
MDDCLGGPMIFSEQAEVAAHCVYDKLVGPATIFPNYWNPMFDDPELRQEFLTPENHAKGLLRLAEQDEDTQYYLQWCQTMTDVINFMKDFRFQSEDPAASSLLAQMADMLVTQLDMTQAVDDVLRDARLTGDCSILFGNDEPGLECDEALRRIQRNKNPGGTVDARRLFQDTEELGANKIAAGAVGGFMTALHLNLPPFLHRQRSLSPVEYVDKCTLSDTDSCVIMKELFGLKLRLYYTYVPLWQEPWYSRRRIIGWRPVWHMRWLPCEYIKSIVYTKDDSDPNMLNNPTITRKEFCDPSLLTYWHWYHPR